jgi:hypothetical protein
VRPQSAGEDRVGFAAASLFKTFPVAVLLAEDA